MTLVTFRERRDEMKPDISDPTTATKGVHLLEYEKSNPWETQTTSFKVSKQLEVYSAEDDSDGGLVLGEEDD